MYTHFVNIESDIQNIGKLETVTRRILDKYELDQELFPSILIALTEAVSNAILHGNKEEKEKQVEVYTFRSDIGLHVRVKDQGDGFDFSNLPDPTLPETIEEEGGRGILLIQELCDECTFEENGSIIDLFFKHS